MGTNRFTEAASKAANLTNKQLASEIAGIGSLSIEKINSLLPLKKDKEVFLSLMKEVEADTNMDQKVAFLQNNVQSVGKVAFKLLKALV